MTTSRRYFRLFFDVSLSDGWVLSDVCLPDGQTVASLWSGLRFEEPGPLEVTVSHTGTVLDFTLTSFNVPVSTRRVADAVLAVADADVQVIPAHVGGRQGVYVLNSLRVIRCLDETRSEFRKFTEHDHRPDRVGQYQMVTRLALDAAAIPPDAHFFRIADWHVPLIVSDQVKAAMEHAGCRGAGFIPLRA